VRQGETEVKNSEKQIGIGGYSPVSYFENGPELGKPEFSAIHKGVTYHFTSKEQVKKFATSPEKFTPAFGGACAFGQSIEKEFGVDPTSYKIVDGRLFLFLKNAEVDALKLWNDGSEKELLAKAEEHFKQPKAA
jgi:YHS domain-containing protein